MWSLSCSCGSRLVLVGKVESYWWRMRDKMNLQIPICSYYCFHAFHWVEQLHWVKEAWNKAHCNQMMMLELSSILVHKCHSRNLLYQSWWCLYLIVIWGNCKQIYFQLPISVCFRFSPLSAYTHSSNGPSELWTWWSSCRIHSSGRASLQCEFWYDHSKLLWFWISYHNSCMGKVYCCYEFTHELSDLTSQRTPCHKSCICTLHRLYVFVSECRGVLSSCMICCNQGMCKWTSSLVCACSYES